MWEQDAELVKNFVSKNPWGMNIQEWRDFAADICKLHKAKLVQLYVIDEQKDPHLQRNILWLNKLSVITLLYFLGAHLGMDAKTSKEYSRSLFLAAKPDADLVRKGEMLVSKHHKHKKKHNKHHEKSTIMQPRLPEPPPELVEAEYESVSEAQEISDEIAQDLVDSAPREEKGEKDEREEIY